MAKERHQHTLVLFHEIYYTRDIHAFSSHIQILVTYFQILGSFTMFSITWPPIAYKMMAWFQSTFKFEVLQMPGLAFSV